MNRLVFSTILAVFALCFASCGSAGAKKLYPVDGKLLYKGKPAAGVQVIFHLQNDSSPQAVVPSGVTVEDGSFTLTSYNTESGAPAGSYYVLLFWPEHRSPGGKTAHQVKSIPGDFFKGRFTDQKKPGFFADVKAAPNHLDPFEIRD
jgi:hypothetical protein